MENFETYRLDQTGQQTQAILDQVSTNTADIAQLYALYEALTQNEPVIIQPTDTWPVADPQENVIYRVIDRVNTPPQSYSDYMWNGTAMVLMATYNNAIDDAPTPGSNNLVKSGGVAASIIFDISAYHATGSTLATYADLAAALGTNGANVPSAVRKGGMSVKFVQSSDNKYVQYFLTKDEWSVSEEDWEKMNLEEEVSQLGQKVGGGFSMLSLPGKGTTYVSGEPVSLIVGHTYILELVSADVTTIPSTSNAYVIEGKDINNQTVAVLSVNKNNLNSAKYVTLPSGLVEVKIDGRADVGGMIKAQLTDITLVNDLENRVEINHSYFNGNGNTYTIGSWITGIIPGHTYRIYLDGIDLVANYARFDIGGYSADNTNSQILFNYTGGTIPDYTDVYINNGIVKLRLAGRDEQGVSQSIKIEDITFYDLGALPISNNPNLNNIISGLYIPDTLFDINSVSRVSLYNGWYSASYQKYYYGLDVGLSDGRFFSFQKKFNTLEEVSAYRNENRYIYIEEHGVCYSFNSDNIDGDRVTFTDVILNPSCGKYGYYPQCNLIIDSNKQEQFTLPKLGSGTFVASLMSETYCHSPYLLENSRYYIINYHSSENSTIENPNSDISLILIDKYSGKKKHLTAFKYNNEKIDNYNISHLYNNTAIMLDDNTINIQVGCHYNDIWGSISRNYNITTGKFSAIEHQKLQYNGNIVEWNLLNYIQMCNAVFDLSLTEQSVVYTVDSFKRYKYNNIYYMVAGGSATAASNDVEAPVVLLTSSDAITWSPVKVLFKGTLFTETEVAVANDRIYLVIRQGGVGSLYAIYDLDGGTRFERTILSTVESKPAVIAGGTHVYLAYNVENSLNSMYWGRTKFRISEVDTSGVLSELVNYTSRNGCNYMDMVVKPNGNMLIAVIEDFRGFNNTPTTRHNCTTDVMLAEVEIPF